MPLGTDILSFKSSSKATMPSLAPSPPNPSVDFDALGWDVNCSNLSKYVIAKCTGGANAKWGPEHYDPATDSGQITQAVKYDTLNPITPSCTSLNYGTTVWEGIKAYRNKDGKVCIFRCEQNYERLAFGGRRMCLPVPSYEMFMRALQVVVQENADLIPPSVEGMKLYLRPILFASGQQLGLDLSPEFSFLVYCAPTGNYFKGKAVAGLKLNIETNYCRAALGGVGNVKIAGNYGITMLPVRKARAAGFNDNVHVDLETYNVALKENKGDKKKAIRESVVQEMSAANVFIVQKSQSRILTPCLERKTILPGVTRNSVVTLIKNYNQEIADALGVPGPVIVEERDVLVRELEEASEAFATGTAAELVPIQSFSMPAADYSIKCEFGEEGHGPVAKLILSIMRGVCYGQREDEFGWNRDPFTSPEAFREKRAPHKHATPLIPESFAESVSGAGVPF